MRLWEITDGGATYWAVAPDIRKAIEVAFACWEQEGSLDDNLEHMDSLAIDVVPDERAQRLTFRPTGDEPQCSMAEEAARQTEARVIACTEWP